MAEEKNSAAQSKLGELFVDIGSSGLGTLVKGLNTASASFLLTTKAAQAFTKPIIDMTKQSIKGAVGISQLGATLGTTAVDAYKLKTYFDMKNLSGLEGDLGNLSKTLTDVSMGVSGISGDMAYAFNQLGLNWQDYNGSLESILRLVKDVQKATEGMDRTVARSYINKIGFSDEWLYAFQRGDFNLDEFKTFITDDDVQTMLDGAEALNKLRIAKEQLQLKGAAKLIDKTNAIDLINTTSDFVSDLGTKEGREKIKNTVKQTYNPNSDKSIFNPVATKNPILKNLQAPLLLNPFWFGATTNLQFYKNYKRQNNKLNKGSIPNIKLDYKNQENQGYELEEIDNPNNLINPKPLNISDAGMEIPPNTTISYNIEINNSNSITGNNATEIADRIAAMTTDDIKYSQYQAHNLPNV